MYGGQAVQTSNTPDNGPVIPVTMERLARVINETESAFGSLSAKLAYVTLPMPPSDQKDPMLRAVGQPQCDMATQLADFAERIERLASAFVNLQGRIQL